MLLNSTELNERFMFMAIEQAKKAAQIGEIPVGAVVIKNKKIISSAFNRIETLKTAIAHAELIAIDLACKKIGNWRLSNCELFVTLQPCLMCLGAISNSRIKKIVYSAEKPGMEGYFEREVMREVCFKNNVEIEDGVLRKESVAILKKFFKNLRNEC